MLVPEPHAEAHGLVNVPLAPSLLPSAEALPVDHLWIVAARPSRELPRVAVTWQFLVDELGGAHRS